METIAQLPNTETPRLGRSVAAVLAGFVTVLVTHTGTDAIFHATGVFPKGADMAASLYGLALAYRCVFMLLGGYVTARLAPRRPLEHALMLGAVGCVPSLGGLVVAIVTSPNLGPVWYPALLLLLTLPSCWLGGRLAKARG